MIYRIRPTEIFTLTHITYLVISNYHKNIHMHSQSRNTGDWERWLPRKQPTDSLYTVLDHEYCKELNESQASSRLEWITLHQRLRIGFRTITTEKVELRIRWMTATREFPPPMPGHDLGIGTTSVFRCCSQVAAIMSGWINPNARQNNP